MARTAREAGRPWRSVCGGGHHAVSHARHRTMGQRRAGCSGLGTRQAASRRLERLLVRRASVPLVPARALTGRSDDVSAQIDLIGVPLLMISEEPSAAPNA
jgi:hypothetical protein